VASPRLAAAGLSLGIGAPILAAALSASGLASWSSQAAAIAAALIVFALFLKRSAPQPAETPLAAVALIASLIAAARMWGLARFMIDPARSGFSVLWFDPFYIRHNCFSAWYEAARLAIAGGVNIYRSDLYAGWNGTFKLDDFMYPSPALILPRLGFVFSSSFLVLRAAWFAVEAALLVAALYAVARWIGGDEGRRATWLVPAVIAATPILLTLQIGNFQAAVLALSMLAMVAFARNRSIAGGALLGFALFKIFPGVLVFYLLLKRRWRDVIWTSFFAALYVGISVAWLGTAPLIDFVKYQLPRIASGEAWAWLQLDGLQNVVAINHGITGLVLKANLVHAIANIPLAMKVVSLLFSILVAAAAIFAAMRADDDDRLGSAIAWIALLGLAALRSPFVPDAYALLAPVWLWSLVTARLWPQPQKRAFALALWLPLSLVLPFEGPLAVTGNARLAIATLIQVLAISLSVSQLLLQRSEKPTLELIEEPA